MKNKGFFNRILSNNIVLLALSLLLSFIIWFVINANSQTESNVTISNIPIKIELSQDAINDGLQVFADPTITASVEVSGNRLTVGSLSASDIEVVALQSNSIIAPGSYTRELSAKKVGVKTNYNFVSNVTPSTLTFFVDKYKEKTIDISDDLVYKVDEGFYANSSFSETSVKVSGPETEVSAIDQVVVRGELSGTSGTTKTDTFDLVFLDKDGNEFEPNMLEADITTVEVSLTPLPILEVELDLDIIDAPKSYPAISMNPRKIKIAAEQTVLDSIVDNTIVIGTLDFSTLRNTKNELSYDIILPNGCKNLSDSTSTTVMLDLSVCKSKTVTVDNFTGKNIDLGEYNVVFNSSGLDVNVCGPSELIESINSGDIIAKVDFSDKLSGIDKESVSLELPLEFSFTKEYLNCWVYGDYTVSVSVTKK